MEIDRPAVAELVADVAAVVARRGAAVPEDVYEAIVQDIPQLRDDKPVLTLLASSVWYAMALRPLTQLWGLIAAGVSVIVQGT